MSFLATNNKNKQSKSKQKGKACVIRSVGFLGLFTFLRDMNTNKASTGEVINLLFVPVSFNNGLSRKRDRHRSPCQVWWFRFYPNLGLSCHSLFSPCCLKKIFEIWKKDHSRNWYVPCRVFRQREISEMLCVWRQYWRGAIYFKTGSVECDKSDNIPPITTSPSYLFSGSNNRQKHLLHDPKTTWKRINLNWHSCP